MPVDTIADFVLYIAPGFIATFIYYRYYPAKERTAFTQTAQSVVWGLVIVTAVRLADQHLLSGTLGSDVQGMPSVALTGALLGAGLVLGYLGVLQLLARSAIARKHTSLRWIAPPPDSIWQYINEPWVRDWAVVHLDDGSSYLGWISQYRSDPDFADQDFLLTHARRVDDAIKELYPVDGIGVYVNTRHVSRIEFLRGKKPAA